MHLLCSPDISTLFGQVIIIKKSNTVPCINIHAVESPHFGVLQPGTEKDLDWDYVQYVTDLHKMAC